MCIIFIKNQFDLFFSLKSLPVLGDFYNKSLSNYLNDINISYNDYLVIC